MSEISFYCSSCGQHLSGDESYAGQQINCPSCGKPVPVPRPNPSSPPPPAPASSRVATPLSPPPLPGSELKPVTQKTCGLAIVSLICSIGSFIIPFGCIPGIICGHIAGKKIAATPGLQGQGLAKAGLIIGYFALCFNVVVILAVIAFFGFYVSHFRAAQRPGPVFTDIQPMPQPSALAPEQTTDSQPDGSGWTKNLAGVETPSGPVSGRIHGQPFKMERVKLQNGWLSFAQGNDFFADREIDVVVFENDATKLSERTFIVPKREFGSNPHIWMKWKEPGNNNPKQRSFTDQYAMRLEFGQLSAGKLPGKIYLCVPDQEKSFIAGTFEVAVKPRP